MSDFALGMVETRGLIAAVEACDAMLKASAVQLVRRRVTWPAIVTICVTGETAAVQAAVDAGARAAAKIGRVLGCHVIPRPALAVEELVGGLGQDSWVPEGRLAELQTPAPRALEEMPVRELRALARTCEGFPLTGREISNANRSELLELLARFPLR